MPASFSTLPPELICQVFESADDFTVVSALAQTARIFYRVWRENPTSICQAVAPRIFSNLPDAERLLDIQEEAEAVSLSQDNREQKSINRAKRLLFNARCASAVSNTWVGWIQPQPLFDGGETPVSPSEIARFQHAFYCLWTIAIIENTPHLHDQASSFFDECSPRELCGLNELADWAMSFNENDFGSLGLDLHNNFWRAGYNLVAGRFMPYKKYQSGFNAWSPGHYFAFFNDTQQYLDLFEENCREGY